jgi:2Fe-2S ferredoxin
VTAFGGARGVAAAACMPKIRVIYESGEPERVVEFDPKDAPFSHDGEPGSILDVLLGHGVHLEHACGGKCACTTCHVVVKDGEASLSEMQDAEVDRLDTAPGLTLHSRLGCQAVVQGDITIVIPKFNVNS